MWRRAMGRLAQLGPIVLLFMIFVPCASAWTWPVSGPVLQTFSFDPAHPYAAGQHRGIAIGADAGTSVVAPAAGVVSFAGTVPTNGMTVTIQTGDGLAVSLTHLGSIGVARDARVAEGAAVGTVGPSGTAEFSVPYVHLGIRTASNEQGYLDPLDFLPVATPPAPVKEPAPPPPSVAPAAPATAVPPAAPAAAPAVSAPVPQPAAAPAPAAVHAPAAPAAAPAVSAEAPAAPAAAEPGQPVEPAGGLFVASSRPRLTATSPVAREPRPVLDPRSLVSRVTSPTRELAAGRRAHGLPTPRVSRPAASAAGLRRARRPTGSHPTLAAAPPYAVPAGRPASEPRHGERHHDRAHQAQRHGGLPVPILALLVLAAAAAACLVAVRMIMSPSRVSEGASAEHTPEEDPGRGRVAVRQRAAAPRPRRGSRGPVRHLRALPPVEGQRRGDGERDGRARHPGDGVRRSRRRLAA